ncbi:polysaccharide pyruvyl transferase CsaB [Synechococcus sp. RedBA-s]|uniref:polysaccharide pyruvyl transferase CsaB n=1 Tax=Synechococcus sp. RedBA-s TaxID=2823741 RepID=UPI0020CE8981|nr:polysaccharide pyruvyl transferase CsaB [Synechococcus sp. RedBA-s]MCP9800565.1 polysaccharide pyruvyl transferase CsaB [Synechococcus sp. RedBA-s]
MGPRQKGVQPLLCGYYGEHNLGDDALLTALLAQLPEGCDPTVTAFDQGEVQQRLGVRTCARRDFKVVRRALDRCDVLVLGGGSLLQDATSFRSLLYYAALIISARLQGKPVLLWGQGLGPLRRRRSRLLVRRLLNLVQASSWRDPGSAALAAAWGRPGQLGSDPVWSLATRRWHGQGGPLVLCWRPTPLLEGERWRPLLEALDAVAAAADREVIWLPFHRDQDRGLLASLDRQGLVPRRLAQRCREELVATPEEAMEIFSGASLVLSMRLHGLIVAALAGAPLVALSYDPKVRAAAQALACPCRDLELPQDGRALEQEWLEQLGRPPQPQVVEGLRQDSRVHGELLKRWLGS